MKTQILDHKQVQKILRRMAYQIYEKNFDRKELVFAAIKGQGVEVAKLVQTELSDISKIKISLLEIDISKDKPAFNSAKVNLSGTKLAAKTVILFDDVLNTGRTLVFAMHPFLQEPLEAIQVAVLVDRNHKSFPVSADFIGISLQTTMQEHVSVTMKAGKISVYLV
ncbi:MAG: phosphoribosyltransferase [Bacteroidetes bacterium B1(2017)]|nr:MAG: phosphoribosyltransferase [Bacteroidetes bacterium B1(2017)]